MPVAYISYCCKNAIIMTGCTELHSYHHFPCQQCGGCGVKSAENVLRTLGSHYPRFNCPEYGADLISFMMWCGPGAAPLPTPTPRSELHSLALCLSRRMALVIHSIVDHGAQFSPVSCNNRSGTVRPSKIFVEY